MPYEDPTKGLVGSLPGIKLIERAGQGGDALLQLLQQALGRGGPKDDMLKQRGKMSEAEYRAYLAQQGQLGQQMSDQSLKAPSPK
jgi:hypothetical protein